MTGLKENKLKRILREGKVAIGPFMKFTDPAAVEIGGFAGFDFVIIDTEHGPISIETAQNLIRAAEIAGITPIIRVKENSSSSVLRALDIGAQGVEIPQISTREDALRAVEAAKFFPEGERGVCRFVRAAGYSSLEQYEYFESSNKEVMVIVHIEGVEGVKNLKDILTVKGLDVIFLGPYDLSSSCGLTGQVNHPLVIKKMEEAVKLSREANIAVGTFVDDIEAAKRWINAGVRYISFSVDVGIFYESCCRIVKNLRDLTINK
ncbi:MAG: aldolase/citrate lyase family protein [Candidatus Aerophobetes bacterium]|nr:aldolase/citrate lyase family protein [Candidatus Aerophobetes bacterium]